MLSRSIRHCMGAAALLIAIVPGSVGARSQDINRTFDVKPGQELRLDLEDLRGEVDIQGWDENRVEFRGHIGGRDWREGDELEFDQSKAGIDVFPNYRVDDDDHVRIELTIKVPREFDVRLRGAVDTRIENVRGACDVSLGNADLDLDKVEGACNVSTANGKMHIKDSSLKGDVSNVNGRLYVTESDLSGEVSSVNGGMKVSRAPEGMEASSVNGSITVGSAMDHVIVSTVNGSVEIEELDGWMEAETTNGAVRLRMVGDPDNKRDLDITTLNGDVEIEIPENYSLAFDIEIESKDRHREHEIISDFDLEIQSDDAGRRRYRVYGEGELGDGRHKVKIRATNGDVILKRISKSG